MPNHITLYQHGTLALLVPGLLKGTISMGELLKHGDTGIGTGEGLDGELIIWQTISCPCDWRHHTRFGFIDDAVCQCPLCQICSAGRT